MPESELRVLVKRYGFAIADLIYSLDSAIDFFEYRMVVRSTRTTNARKLSETLCLPAVKECRLSPTGD